MKRSLLSLFWRFIEFPLNVEENVAWQHVDICFRAGLSVHPVCYVAEAVEDVEAVDYECQSGSWQSVAYARVPHEIVGIQLAGRVAPAGKDGEVGRNLKVCRQFVGAVHAVVEVDGVEIGESGS